MPRTPDARAALALVLTAGGRPQRITTHGTHYLLPNGATVLLAGSMGGRALTNFKAALKRVQKTT